MSRADRGISHIVLDRPTLIHDVRVVPVDAPVASSIDPGEGRLALHLGRASLALPSATPLWTSGERVSGGRPLYQAFTCDAGILMDCAGPWPGRILVARHGIWLDEEGPVGSLESVGLGLGLALWLEMRGHPVLHANAIGLYGGAIALLGASGAGKSSLTAALLREGALLLSDDLLPLRLHGRQHVLYQGTGRLKLWPDVGERLCADYASWEPWVPGASKRQGSFGTAESATGPTPLRRILILARQPAAEVDTPRRQQMAPSSALAELLAASLAGDLLRALGLEAARLPRLADLVESVPVERLLYPSGLERIGTVARAVAAGEAAS